MTWPWSWMRKLVMLGLYGAVGQRVNDKFCLMTRTVIQVRECNCELDQPCVCNDLEAMLEEAENTVVIQKGFKVGPEQFDVGPGAALSDGEELINLYFHKGERDPELREQPALTVGFTKEGAAKLLYTLLNAAKAHNWIEDE